MRVALVAFVFFLAGCARHDDRRAASWREDLHALATELPAKHKNAFFHVREPDWRTAVDELDRAIPTLDDAHVVAGLARLVAALGDGHTSLQVLGRGGMYPLSFVWFDDGIFVAGAPPDHPDVLGAKVVGIGGKSIDDAVAALTPLISHDNDAGLHGSLPLRLADAGALAGVGLAANDHATYRLTTADGNVRDLELHAGPFDRLPGVTAPKVLPLHLQGPNTSYWNKYVESDRLLYLAYNHCGDDSRVGPFWQFAERTLAFADQHQVDAFVIDLRGNQGGTSWVIEPLIVGLEKRPALAGRVYVITGMHMFSSAILNAMELKTRLHATLVGGPTAGSPSHYGEVQKFELPHSKIPVWYSTTFHSYPDFPGDALKPDLPVKVTSADWFSGRDPAIDAIVAAARAPK